MNTCIECGRRMSESDSYYEGAAARALIPLAGRLMSDGPFCSKGCKRDYMAAKGAQAEGKALKKEAKSLGLSGSSGYDAADLQEQRRIMELRKEEREAEELRVSREKEEEETRQRQAKAAVLRDQGHPTRAFLLHHQSALLGGGAMYVFAAFTAVIVAGEPGRPANWIGVVAGLLLVGGAVLVVRRIAREKAAVRANG